MQCRRVSAFVLATTPSNAGAQDEAPFTLAPDDPLRKRSSNGGARGSLPHGIDDQGMWVAGRRHDVPDTVSARNPPAQRVVTLRDGNGLARSAARRDRRVRRISLTDSAMLGSCWDFPGRSPADGVFLESSTRGGHGDPFVHPDLPAGPLGEAAPESETRTGRCSWGELQTSPDPQRKANLARYTVDALGRVLSNELLASRNCRGSARRDQLQSMRRPRRRSLRTTSATSVRRRRLVGRARAVPLNMEPVLAAK
jgi:hypothetical protein